jgi:hypothetical protein
MCFEETGTLPGSDLMQDKPRSGSSLRSGALKENSGEIGKRSKGTGFLYSH